MVIDGKTIAGKRLGELKIRLQNLKKKPKLAVILVGNDSGSELYVKMKNKRAEEAGIETVIVRFPRNIDPVRLIKFIDSANHDSSVTGILVQLPLPEKLAGETQKILDSITPTKDVDCLTTANLELLNQGKPRYLPATVKAIITIIESLGFKTENLQNKIITIVGQGKLVGKPLADYLESQGVKVNRCDINTRDLSIVARQSDILIVATGVPKLIKADLVKPGAIVIDCGAPEGEVDTGSASMAGWITPVPGGVGPVTVVSLLENVAEAGYNNEIKHG